MQRKRKSMERTSNRANSQENLNVVKLASRAWVMYDLHSIWLQIWSMRSNARNLRDKARDAKMMSLKWIMRLWSISGTTTKSFIWLARHRKWALRNSWRLSKRSIKRQKCTWVIRVLQNLGSTFQICRKVSGACIWRGTWACGFRTSWIKCNRACASQYWLCFHKISSTYSMRA